MISIIVPVYNVEKFLPQCLDSLVNQTYRDLEIICVNDGSTDRSLAILEKYAAKDERISIISQDNQGVSYARNKGLQVAKGDWIMFVDSDDWIETDCCQKVLDVSQDSELGLFSYIREFKSSSAPKRFMGNEEIEFDETNIHQLYERLIAPKGKELKHPDNIDSLSTPWGKLYSSEIIRDYHLSFVSTNEIGTEDLLFNVEYFKYVRRAFYISECLYHYRKSTLSTLTSLYKEDLDKKWLRMFERIENVITPLNRPELREALSHRKALSLLGLGLNITFCRESFLWKHKMLDVIITSDWYSTSISHLDINPMPLHWKTFYSMARQKQTWVVLLMLQIMNRIINR
jgi:glycosyltransferase EpsH